MCDNDQEDLTHNKIRRYITRSSKLHAHDETNQCSIGDTVIVRESRPLSKSKTWTLDQVVEKAAEL